MKPESRKTIQRRWTKKAIERGYFKHYQRRKRKELRDAVLNLLGRSCRKCGFVDERALQVDHINGGGRQESLRGHMTMYRKILQNPVGYQVLCANCNWIKRYENREGNDSNDSI